jgi:beta-galactosidase
MRIICITFISLMVAVSAATPTETSPRQRINLNADWRFLRGDPAGLATNLFYDIRLDKSSAEDEQPGDPEGTPVAADAHPSVQGLKPWILPSGNDFIRNPGNRHERPEGDPGGEQACMRPDYDDSNWERVDLPHDWAIGGPFDVPGKKVSGGMGRLPSPGVGWYRRKLDIPIEDAGKSIVLEVEGAMSYAVVWLNGNLVGGWPYGYASWQVHLTPHVLPGGENQLVIRLDNPPESARWYPGGGLYRDVWLSKTGPVHVPQWGTFVTTPQVSAESAEVHLEVAVENTATAATEVFVTTEVFELREGHRSRRAVAALQPVRLVIPAGERTIAAASTMVHNPKRWGPPPTQTPHRYLAVTTLSDGAKVLDEYETLFGIRAVEFDPDQGVLINGEHIFIRGVNLHHDLGALGAAFNRRAAERQLEILADMGCNAIRTAHNPPCEELLDMCDRMGFMVMDEAFDEWLESWPFGGIKKPQGKAKYGYCDQHV